MDLNPYNSVQNEINRLNNEISNDLNNLGSNLTPSSMLQIQIKVNRKSQLEEIVTSQRINQISTGTFNSGKTG